MASSFQVFRIQIPSDNGYASQPNQVTDRIVPHIQEQEPYAEMTQISNAEWQVTTPSMTAGVVKSILEKHYGFIVSPQEVITK